jgi:glycerol-3-phosphate dehydrogenase (NAD(P)+)
MTEVAEELLKRPAAALSGPSLAAEVACGIPTAVTIACTDHVTAKELQDLLMNPFFRVYTSDDVIGVEIGGALKNVISIAAGVCDGISFGDNTKAALMTRGLAEITRLGCALGAHPATFAGLSGMGDLVVTCASRLSRNHMVGERLGRGEAIDYILKSMEQVAEGVWTCATARALARKHNIEVPITEEVYAVIREGKDPRAAVRDLMGRDPKAERE